MYQWFFIVSQYVLPQHALSRLAGWVAECRWVWLKDYLITRFVAHYRVDLQEAEITDPRAYSSFNAFFTRALKSGARPLVRALDAIVSPADGMVSQCGTIEQGQIVQAKGHNFSVTALLGGDSERAAVFLGGAFATIYLSPRDYHRVHMPKNGTLREMVYIPGALFSVNQVTAERVPCLFARNERVVCLFDTAQGPMAIVLVGAMIVGSIETQWAGQIAPMQQKIQVTRYQTTAAPIVLAQGQELGRFKLGSTAIVLFGPNAVQWTHDLHAGSTVRMGGLIGSTMAQ